MPRGSHIAAVVLLLAASACRTFDPKHPLVGKPSIERGQTGYWIWYDDGQWSVRFAAAGKARRFQGSVAGVRGSVANLALLRPEAKDTISMSAGAVQFDVEVPAGSQPDGFDVKILGGCANFDLYVDSAQRVDQVRLGPKLQPARRIPFEKCP
jgi:hypothetical protein